MNALQKTFLSMIKTALWNEPFANEEGVSVSDLFAEACRYEITGVLSSKLDVFCADDIDIRAKWSKKAMNDYRKSSYVLASQVALCKLLEKENIKPVFLKGMASAFYYQTPLLREIGDIDFIVLPDQFEKCCVLLEQKGYEKGEDCIRHLQYQKQGIEYECHRYFSRDLSLEDKNVDQIIFNGCLNCVTRIVEGKSYYALPDDVYGIVLLEHLKHHFTDGVGFRQIMDWVVYANAVLNDEMWNNNFQEKAKKCGLERLAKCMTRTAQLYLGLKEDDITWCMDIDESLSLELIEHVFQCNNFGFTEESNEDVHKFGSIIRQGIFRDLNIKAMSHMPIAKKIIILRPIAWLYQILRWIVKGVISFVFKRNQGLKSLNQWKKQQELLKNIGV